MPYDDEEDRDDEEAQRILEEAGLDSALENLERGTSAALSGDDDAPSATQDERPEPFPIERTETQREADRIVEEAGVDRSLSAFPSAPIAQAPPAAPPELRGASSAAQAPEPTPPAAPPADDDDAAVVDALAERGPTAEPAEDAPIQLEEFRIAAGPAAPTEPAAVADAAAAAPPQPLRATPAAPAAAPEEQAEAAAVDAIAAGAETPPGAPAPAEDEAADAGALATLSGEPAAALGSPTQKPPRDEGFLAQQKDRVARIEQLGQEAMARRIPSEGDIADARTRDFFRQGLGGGLVAALRGLAGGRATSDIPSEAERLLADRQRMLGEKRTARQEQAATTAAEAQRAREARELGLRERQITQQGDIARATAGRQAAAAESQAATARTQQALNEERLRGQVSERELADRRRLLDSRETTEARLNARATLNAAAARNPRIRAMVDQLLPRVDEMTAEQLETALRTGGEWAAIIRPSGGVRVSTGGGGGGGQLRTQAVDVVARHIAGPDATPEQVEAARPEAEVSVQALGPQRAIQQTLSDSMQRGRAETRGEQSEARATSGRVETGVANLGRALDANFEWRQALERARGIDPSLLHAVFWTTGIPSGFTPDQVQEARAAVNELRGAKLQLRSGASVSEQEFDRMEQEMGATRTSSPEVFMNWLQRQQGADEERSRRIRARYSDDVIGEYERRLGREGAGGGGGGRATPQASGDMVPMMRPGATRPTLVHRDNVAAAEADGYTRVQ